MKLENKTIVITGGVIRVGRQITLELLGTGANIYCHYNRSQKAAESLKKDAGKNTDKLSLIQGDLSSVQFAEEMIEQIISESGKIDVLINNAAIFFKTPLGEVTEKEWDDLFQLNLKSAFFCAQKTGIHMKKHGGGKIVNIGDPSGSNPWPSFIPYGLTKSGIISMTRGLAKALAPEVQVNCINPGPVMLPDEYTAEEKEQALQRTLLKKEGSPDDVAKTIRFILEGSDYITGAVINVDGGRSIA